MPPSPLESAVAKVGDRWSLLVVEALLDGSRRFGELQALLPGIAPNVLSQRLKHLEHGGVVVARAYSQRPLRYAYSLTAMGQELGGAIRLFASWGAAHAEDARPPSHLLCGTPLEARWYCPTCDLAVADADEDDLRYA